MTIIVLVVYLLVLIFIAFQSSSKITGHSDFFVAHKKGTYITITGSLIATILGGSAVIGAIDAGPGIGWATSWFMLSAAFGLLALIPLTKRISKLGRFTLPDLLEDLFGASTKRIASIVIPIAWLGVVAAQLIASARILQSFTELPYVWGVIISGIVFTGYTIAGGQISILKTDFIQSILILIGLAVIAIFVFKKHDISSTETKLVFPFNSNFKPIDLIILLVTYSTTFTAGPDIYSRIFCTTDERVAKKSVLTTALILIPVAAIIGYLSVFGAGLTHHSNSSVLVEISQLVLPEWIVPIVVIALISAVLSSADTTILSASIIITDLVEKSNFGIKSLLKSRIIIAIIGIISIVISIQFTSIIGMLLIALSIYSGAFILPILFGLSGLKLKSSYVSLAIITGGTIALAGKLIYYNDNTTIGNYIILSAFVINGLILLMGIKQS